MTNEEKKLGISSIDDHLDGRRVLEEYVKNKTKRRAVEESLKLLVKP